MKDNLIKTKSFNFAVRIVKMYQFLVDEKKEYVLSKQLLRSGTSIGANVCESERAISKKDFVNKISISQKEANETLYWIELLFATGYIDNILYESMKNDCLEIVKILTSISKTSIENLK